MYLELCPYHIIFAMRLADTSHAFFFLRETRATRQTVGEAETASRWARRAAEVRVFR